MRYIFIAAIVLFSVACSSNKYLIKENEGNFDQLRAGDKYVFFHGNDLKTDMQITAVEKDSIIRLKDQTRVALAKNAIWEVRRNNTAGTVILAGSVIGGLVLIAVLVANFIDGASKVGNAIGGQ